MADQPVSGVVSGLTSNPPFSTKVSYSRIRLCAISVETLFTSAAAAGISISSTNPDLKNAYMQTFNLNVQQQAPWGDCDFESVITVRWAGICARRRTRTSRMRRVCGRFRCFPLTSPIDPGKSSNSNIGEVNDVGYSNYNALWLVASKNAGHGLQFNMNYEWSKSMDTNSLGSQGGYTFQDSTNPAEQLRAFRFRHTESLRRKRHLCASVQAKSVC